MPNVMGREFPYTPEGMAAAEQYKQAMGMRDGGMMGFRPLQMQGGGTVQPASGPQVGADVMAVFQDLVDLTQRGSTAEVRAYVGAHRPTLDKLANTLPRGQANFVQNILDSFAAPSEQGGNLVPGTLGSELGVDTFLQGAPADAPPMSDRDLADLYRVVPERRMPPEGGDQLLVRPPNSPRGSDIDYGRRTTEDLNYVSHLLDPETIRRFEDIQRDRQNQTGGVPLGYTMGVESARVPGESLVSEFRGGGLASLRRY